MNYETDKKLRVSSLRKQIAACLPDTSQVCAFQEAFARQPASAIAFAIGKLEDKTGSHLLWVQEERAIKQQGRPFIHGLPPSLRHSIIHVTAASAKDALWAMEEGLRCPSLMGVIGEITGDPAALDFTASRDRKSTRLNSSHVRISYAVFCLKKKKKKYNVRHSKLTGKSYMPISGLEIRSVYRRISNQLIGTLPYHYNDCWLIV